jgi:TonB family protein
MSAKTKVWLLIGVVAALAVGVTLRIAYHRDEPAKEPAAVASSPQKQENGAQDVNAVAPQKQEVGFGKAAEAPKKRAASAESPTTPVDILDKPHPQYTAEGRSLKIEGDVVLEMVFLANGTIQVNRVVSGLGHGLDEAATRAAQQIKFKPAKRDGKAVDFPARVRIEFRLAY